MNISFDLDGTIIPYSREFELEERSWMARLFRVERLRKGTKELFHLLRKDGHNIHIYTTSYRSKTKIRKTFFFYGIKIDQIINQPRNLQTLESINIKSSKYPSAFHFDCHVDDSEGVLLEGERLGFKVILIKPSDNNWVDTVKKSI